MKAIHLISKRDGASLKGLTHTKGGLSRSGHWDLSEEQAQSLVGGWLYLHPTKAAPSEFGGRIAKYEKAAMPELGHPDRIVFFVERHRDGKDRKWRGASHGLAHSGGIVDADLPHERTAN